MRSILINIDSNSLNNKGEILLGDRIKNISSVTILNVSMPSSSEFPELYYNINSEIKNNNSFNINSNIISIPSSFYTISTLISTLTPLLANIDITLSVTDNVVTLTSATPFTLSDISNSLGYYTLLNILGIKQSYTNVTQVIGTEKICIPNDNYIFMNINNEGFFYNVDNGVLNNCYYYAKIIPYYNPLTSRGTMNTVTVSNKFKLTTLDKLTVQLYTPYNNLLQVNNLNFHLTLHLDINEDLI